MDQTKPRPFNVINPKHYRSHPSGLETIELVEHFGFNLGNCFKYVARAGLKGDAEEDLRKSLWYCERLMLISFNDVDVGRPHKPLIFWTKVHDWLTAETDPNKREVLSHISAAAKTQSRDSFDNIMRRLHKTIADMIIVAQTAKAV